MKYQLPAISPEERLRIIRERRYETIVDASKRIGVSKATLYRWIERGEIAEIKLGSMHFVLTDSLDAKFAAGITQPDTGEIEPHLRGDARRFALRDACFNVSTKLPITHTVSA